LNDLFNKRQKTQDCTIARLPASAKATADEARFALRSFSVGGIARLHDYFVPLLFNADN